jgi:hypothetical protein
MNREDKSTRHSKIAGDFGETLVLYWLSKNRFECAKVDHTGIDLIARNPHTREVMGISVKSRTRSEGTEKERVNLPTGDFDKIEAACLAFNCAPYIAVVVDGGNSIRVFITSVAHALELCPRTPAGSGWRMSDGSLTLYSNDPQVMAFKLESTVGRWWKSRG